MSLPLLLPPGRRPMFPPVEAIRPRADGLVAITISFIRLSVCSVLSQRLFRLASGAMGFASEMLCGSVLLLLGYGAWLWVRRRRQPAAPTPA